MTEQNKRPDNPAKRFLKGYRALLIRRESLIREIVRRRESATGTTVRLKPISVTSGNGAYDRMAEDVALIADMEETVQQTIAEINRRIREILDAIEAVPDEMQKTVLTLRYITGMDWQRISDKIGYEERQTYILHGKGLWAVNQWMEKTAHSSGLCDHASAR